MKRSVLVIGILMAFSQASIAKPFKNLNWMAPGKYLVTTEFEGRSDMNYRDSLNLCHDLETPTMEHKGCSLKIVLDTPQEAIAHVKCVMDGQEIDDYQQFIAEPPIFRALSKTKIGGQTLKSETIFRRLGDCK